MALALLANCAGPAKVPTSVETHALVRKAEVLYSQGDFAGAVAAYRSVVAVNPKQQDAWASLGFALIKDAQPPFDEAREAFEEAIRIDPRFADPHQGLGILYTELGNLAEAEVRFRAANRLSPGGTYSPDEILRRGALLAEGLTFLEKDSRYDEVLAAYDQAIARSPENIEAWRRRASLLLMHREIEPAAASYRELISLGVEDREILDLVTSIYFLHGKREEGLVVWDLWLAEHPSDSEAHFERGELLFLMDRLDEAVVAYERTIDSDPDNVEAHYARAESLNFLERSEEALEAFGRVVELDPDNFDAHFEMGLLLETLGEPLAALDAHARASASDPTATEPIYTRGVLFGELERFEEAQEAFLATTNLDPDHEQAWANLGWTHLQLGDKAASLEATERALNLDPDDAVALTNQGVALLNLGRNEEALVAFDRVLETVDAPSNHFNRSLALRDLNRREEAMQALERSVALQHDKADAWMVLAETAIELGLDSRASEAVERLATLQPRQASAYLNGQAWILIDPDRQDRTTDVALGLRLARAALELDPRNYALRDTLAWALFSSGQYQEALLQSKTAIELAPEELDSEYQGYLDRMTEMSKAAEAARSPGADDHE